MDKAEKETHDFMKVKSFSDLPFTLPAPVKEKGIRLFGIEFGGVQDSTTTGVAAPAEYSGSSETNEETIIKDSETTGDNNNRRFVCHYCYRNFPTSQALGGHQNAHKRERQHAKRAQLHSAMFPSGSRVSDPDLIYGRLVNNKTSSAAGPTPAAMTYPSWNSHSRGHHPAGFYSSHGQQQPINGSPLGLWRIPAVHGRATTFIPDRSWHPMRVFAGEELRLPDGGSSSSKGRYGYETKPSVQDHLSLDLHL